MTKVVDEQEHLAIPERLALQKILKTYLNLFQGLRGNWKGKPIHLEFVPGSKPHTSRPFPILQAYRRLVKEEVARLVEIGLLTKVEASEWSSPSFAIPKKNNTIGFVTDCRVLNTKLSRKPYPLPLIQEALHNLGQFRYATCVDLNMGYYSMKLDEESQKKCVTCLPWGLYAYNMLPMGLKLPRMCFKKGWANYLQTWKMSLCILMTYS